jgi:hypothetical protein
MDTTKGEMFEIAKGAYVLYDDVKEFLIEKEGPSSADYPPPTRPGWYWILPRLSENYIRSLPPELKEMEVMSSIRVIRVDYATVDGVRQLCAIHPCVDVPIMYHKKCATTWGPRVPDWVPRIQNEDED